MGAFKEISASLDAVINKRLDPQIASVIEDADSMGFPLVQQGRLLQRFTFFRELGKGSFGTVYHVQDLRNGEEYAMKFNLINERWTHWDLVEAFAEFDVVLKLQNANGGKPVPHIIPTLDVGFYVPMNPIFRRLRYPWNKDASVCKWDEQDSRKDIRKVAKTYYPGWPNLADPFTNDRRAPRKIKVRAQILPPSEFGVIGLFKLMRGSLQPNAVLRMPTGLLNYNFRGLLRALEYLKNADAVHRDIKPQNILADSNGLFYLADFGLARLLRDPQNPCHPDSGTDFFKFPCPRSTSDNASDVFALLISFVYLLFGEDTDTSDILPGEILQRDITKEKSKMSEDHFALLGFCYAVCQVMLECSPGADFSANVVLGVFDSQAHLAGMSRPHMNTPQITIPLSRVPGVPTLTWDQHRKLF